jgi:hypothetical protein
VVVFASGRQVGTSPEVTGTPGGSTTPDVSKPPSPDDRAAAIDGTQRSLQEIAEAATRYRALMELAPIVVYEWEFGDPGHWRYFRPPVEKAPR